eukprot:7698439-Pyramimonas_sp.AAC.1
MAGQRRRIQPFIAVILPLPTDLPRTDSVEGYNPSSQSSYLYLRISSTCGSPSVPHFRSHDFRAARNT